MTDPLQPTFRTLHALRIRGMTDASHLAEIGGLDEAETVRHLQQLEGHGAVRSRPERSMWQLLPDGRALHARLLALDVDGLNVAGLSATYEQFTGLNTQFKELCGAWQLRDGAINDHADSAYDSEVLARLEPLHAAARTVVVDFGRSAARLDPYARRLDDRARRVAVGDTKMLAGVMCGSYHDVWMELHEDMILTLGISRADEGSY